MAEASLNLFPQLYYTTFEGVGILDATLTEKTAITVCSMVYYLY